jgi:hypothetical protein
VHTFALDGGTYGATGEHTGELRTTLRRPVHIDLGALLR